MLPGDNARLSKDLRERVEEMPGSAPIPLDVRLWPKIDAGGDCWEWIAGRDAKGYGRISVDRRARHAHRVVWSMLVGPIPDRLEIDHRCRNHGCVNPDHLELVTRRVNVRRGYSPAAFHARKIVCPAGHDLTDPANVREDSRGRRICLPCRQALEAARRDSHNAARRAARARIAASRPASAV